MVGKIFNGLLNLAIVAMVVMSVFVVVIMYTTSYEDESVDCTIQGTSKYTTHTHMRGILVSHDYTKIYVDSDGIQHTLTAGGLIDLAPYENARMDYEIASYITGGTKAVNGKLITTDKVIQLIEID